MSEGNMVDEDPGEAALSTRRSRTREKLLDAAYSAFAEQGIAQTSVEAIVEKAGFTRGAYYSNFASKTELFLALADRKISAILGQLQGWITKIGEEAAAQHKPIKEIDVPAMFGELLSSIGVDRSWYVIDTEFRLMALRDPEITPFYQKYRDDYSEKFQEFVRQISEVAGLTWRVDSKMVVEIAIAAFDGYCEVGAFAAIRRANRDEGLDQAIANVVRALLA